MDSRSSQTRKKEEHLICIQTPDKDCVYEDRFKFGKFVAREAIIDEKFWVDYRSSLSQTN
uniref:Uncharacterized protein n=1 Tax=Manihot esculenta TaxID=3983 RepID=A0A2C9VH48_MANES